VDPLFSEHAVFKEVNAVNSEYEIDISEDGWKLYHLISLLTNPAHPNSRFSIGNSDSLDKRGVVAALKTFFDSYYSSNLMALVIKTKHPVTEIESWLLKSDFLKIKNKNLPTPNYHKLGLPIGNDNLASLVKFNLKGKTKSVVFLIQLSES
jgi:insulysin